MKIIKIGGINWQFNDINYSNFFVKYYIVKTLNILSNKYKYEYIEDPYNEECQIIIYSLWGDIINLKKCKGNPIFIYWTNEYLSYGMDKKIWDFICDKHKPYYDAVDIIFNFYKNNNYSISFNSNTENNLYFPYWLIEYNNSIYFYNRSITNNYRNVRKKHKFCIFCSSYENDYYDTSVRINLVKELNNYKTVSCCGKGLHNTGDFFLPLNCEDAQDYCKDHKFYISFENSKSFGDTRYVTEKLLFGWRYACVPLYWGDNRGLEYFNKNAFIDLSNCNQDEMIQKIIDLDHNNAKIQYILNQYLFKDRKINYKEMFDLQLVKFIENIIN